MFPFSKVGVISIHAPHAGSDYTAQLHWPCWKYFNPRSPCGERLSGILFRFLFTRFQSTLPMRGATFFRPSFPPHFLISIHAPHAGSDELLFQFDSFVLDFNPRSPCGERLTEGHGPLVAYNFNPRSPCGERPQIARQRRRHRHFNPRSPCGERLESGSPLVWLKAFQSTLPMRGATTCPFQIALTLTISIHAPHAGSDWVISSTTLLFRISIHAPHAGSDPCERADVYQESLFQSTLPMRGAT